MDRTSTQPLTVEEIHALVDSQADPATLADLRARLQHDSAAQIQVDQWQQQRNALQSLHAQILQASVPEPLMYAAQQTTTEHQRINQWSRWGGIAAMVVLSFGTGWLSHRISAPNSTSPLNTSVASSAMTKRTAAQEFARQASFAHGVYSPEVRHPVEVAAVDQEHLVQWLSKRIGKPLKVPNLGAQGYELVGGRLLPGEAGARAQFMFQNTSGMRITLYLGVMDKFPSNVDAMTSGFAYSEEGPTPGFYWIDQGFGYALAGSVQKEVLMQLAQAVYSQL